jgi:hypothetical protein
MQAQAQAQDLGRTLAAFTSYFAAGRGAVEAALCANIQVVESLEGILPNGRFFISQPYVAGEHPDRLDLHRWLRGLGWQMYLGTDNIWHSPDGRIFLSEAHIGNFIQQEAACVDSIRPIDVALHSIEEWQSQIDPDEFCEVYGLNHLPVSLEALLESAGGDLADFLFNKVEASELP